ncbi:MAG: universal stress protein [Desulfatirhabdiaceae bacterium]
MIPDIKKILYATDLSDNARHAYGYAASIANRFGAEITVLHVIEELSQQLSFQMVDLLGEEKWQELQKSRSQEVVGSIRKKLDAFCRDMDTQNAACPFAVSEIKVIFGNPVEEIINESNAAPYDLVVMGTYGHGVLAGAMMGSTAMRVVRRSVVPVTVVRLPKNKP